MKLHTDSKLYIEFADFISAGWPENTVRVNNTRGGSRWVVIKNPSDRRKPMVQYDTLSDQNKEKLHHWLRKLNGCDHAASEKCECGNPYTYVAKQPIRDMIKKDHKAETFYTQYRYTASNNLPTPLPTESIFKYTNEASLLNMLVNAKDNSKKVIKDELNLKIDTFFQHVSEIIKAEINQGNITGKFPTSYQRILEKITDYKSNGYPSLIHKSFGNQSAAKINDEVSESLLIQMINHPNQYDDVLIAAQYNKWANENGRKTIEPATVGVWRRKVVVDGREGMTEYNRKVRRKVSRMRPSQPTFLWESDDNHLDWWFQGDKSNEYRKIKGIIVTDSFNDYVLGWAITDGELAGDEIVRLAYLNAIYHIRELTGGWYLPNELKTDQWNIKQLRPFYKGIGNYYDTPVGSKNRGWLENFFGHKDWERSLKIGNNNYTGHNITAKTTGVNMEAVKSNRHNWPHISEAGRKMEEFVHRLRTMPINYDEKNPSRQQQWLKAFNAMNEADKILISDEQMLLKFGFKHKHSNRITDQGIKPTIGGTQYHYSIPHEHYLHNHGKNIEVIYDPYDMNRVLVTDNNGLRFIAPSVEKVPGCMADMRDGGRALLNKILGEAKRDAETLSTQRVQRETTLLNNGVDVEDVIKLGVSVPKEQKQLAESIYNLPAGATVIELNNEPEEFDVHKAIMNR